MTPEQIISDLKSRGEKHIVFSEDGLITSQHGQNTINYWIVENEQLKCIDCRTTSY